MIDAMMKMAVGVLAVALAQIQLIGRHKTLTIAEASKDTISKS